MSQKEIFGNGSEELKLNDMEKVAGGAKQYSQVNVYKSHFARCGPGTDYPEMEDGACAHVVADVDIYDGGVAGYMNDYYLKDVTV